MELSSPVAVDEQQKLTENIEQEEEKAVNGKLDINIKDNSISEIDNTQYQQLNDFKHNYHWFIESCAHWSHMA